MQRPEFRKALLARGLEKLRALENRILGEANREFMIWIVIGVGALRVPASYRRLLPPRLD